MKFDGNDIAYCGLWCPACSFRVYSETGDGAHIAGLPERYEHLKQLTREQMACGGCKSEDCDCDPNCAMRSCAPGRGLALCSDCQDFPCQAVLDFEGDGAPHHREGIQHLRRIREVGREAWFEEYKAALACSGCGRRQSWYDRCGCGGAQT